MWFSSAGLAVGPDDLNGHFQSKTMYDSTKPGQHLLIPTAPVPPGTRGHLSPAPLDVSTDTEHGVIAGAGQQTVLQHCWWQWHWAVPSIPAGGASVGQPEPEELSCQVGNRKLQSLAGEHEHS